MKLFRLFLLFAYFATNGLPAIDSYEKAPIFYSKTTPDDRISKLKKALESGDVQFDTSDSLQFLKEILLYLEIPYESQVLVFSKTSMQNSQINPSTPRAIYFSDDCYLGYVQNGHMEISTSDPLLGAVFYLLEYHNEQQPLKFSRPFECLNCHGSTNSGYNPGYLIRSVFPDEKGFPILRLGSFRTTHESPLAERWGGWYVTGSHGSQKHMGNTIASIENDQLIFEHEKGANVNDLSPYFDTNPYLLPQSDVVALMVLEHQSEMQNRLNDANISVRQALYRYQQLQTFENKPQSNILSNSALSIAKSHTEKILEQLLFYNEHPLEDDGIDGNSNFQEAFRKNRRENSEGRSLKDFQLLSRLFKYRCSYMIYSPTFDNLIPQLKKLVFQRLWEILNESPEQSTKYNYLSTSERKRILAILTETMPNLPDYWHK